MVTELRCKGIHNLIGGCWNCYLIRNYYSRVEKICFKGGNVRYTRGITLCGFLTVLRWKIIVLRREMSIIKEDCVFRGFVYSYF